MADRRFCYCGWYWNPSVLFKLLNYFIMMKIEAESDLEPLERETKLKRTFRVQEGEDSDEERINIFREINNSDN